MRILGVHDGVNASACLLEDGVLRYALQEERFSGIKNHVGVPWHSVAKILELAKLDISQIDEIALATDYVLRSVGTREAEIGDMTARNSLRESLMPLFAVWEDAVPVIKEKVPELFAPFLRTRNLRRFSILRNRLNYFGQITVVDHHIAHGAAALYSAPWRDEPVLVLTKDAAGDGLCSSVSIAENYKMRRIAKTLHTHSYGYLYAYTTKYMGMKPHQDEHKVMGLAPHGSPKRGQKAYDVFKSYVGLGKNPLTWQRKIPEPLHYIMPKLVRDLHGIRFDDIAWGLQSHLEDLMVSWVRNAVLKTGIRKVVAGGGVFMNVKANKLIREMPQVEGFFPMPSAGDESTSIGAAQWLYAQRMKEQGSEVNNQPLGPLYLGDDITERDMEDAFDKVMMTEIAAGDHYYDPYRWEGRPPEPWDVVAHTSHVDDLVADLLIKGEIVARARGPMEFGARALGNRSILCDASNLRNVSTINSAIKSRDFWMPFAPIVDSEWADVYFKNPAEAPYMTMAFDTTPAAQIDLIAAIHQADNTARPQVLEPGWNDGVHDIITAFEFETDRGGLLNTSFNLHGKPIVHGAEEALGTFIFSGLKNMVVGDYLLRKK